MYLLVYSLWVLSYFPYAGKTDTILYSLSYMYTVFFSSLIVAVLRISRTILKITGERKDLCYILDFKERVFKFFFQTSYMCRFMTLSQIWRFFSHYLKNIFLSLFCSFPGTSIMHELMCFIVSQMIVNAQPITQAYY